MHPHPTMLAEQLLPIVTRSFNSVPHNDNPDADDIITLYLQLPFEHTDEHGTPYVCRSALTSLLAEADEITGHNKHGEVVDEDKLANLLGAMGYLALIDQAGKVLQWTDRDPSTAATAFERILIQHGAMAR